MKWLRNVISVKQKNTKLVTWILVALLAGIWGEIGYKLFIGNIHGDNSTLKETDEVPNSPTSSEKPYIFAANVRDPFCYHEPVKSAHKEQKFVPSVVHPWMPPPFSLEGVIWGQSKGTAVLRNIGDTTTFLSVGDTLKGVKILRVNHGAVEYRYQDKDTSWVLGKQ